MYPKNSTFLCPKCIIVTCFHPSMVPIDWNVSGKMVPIKKMFGSVANMISSFSLMIPF